MRCEEIRQQLGPYLDNELPSGVEALVSAHLEACKTCRLESAALNRLASQLERAPSVPVPDALWNSIEHRLDTESPRVVTPPPIEPVWAGRRGPLALAAAVILAVGLGTMGLMSSESHAQPSVSFCVLLDALPLDAHKAFRKFLVLYDAKQVTPVEARRHAPELSFDTPTTLPGGFRLQGVYLLRFGERPGIAARYDRNGEFLAAIFHTPVRQEHHGTHKDLPCVVGQHRGHKVQVGDWKLVHLTDPTTCHCVLSRLDEQSELPSIMAVVAPPAR